MSTIASPSRFIPSPSGSPDLVTHLSRVAASTPDRIAFSCVSQSDAECSVTCASLAEQADRGARALLDSGRPGDRVLLMLPQGVAFLVAFFAALRAGMVPVPAFPPQRARGESHGGRLRAIVDDCAPSIGIVEDDEANPMPLFANAKLRLLRYSDLVDGRGGGDLPLDVRPEDIAFLQYTSGSTAMPKGVMVSHANIMANIAAMDRFLKTDGPVGGWLPLFHDMGLIGIALLGFVKSVPCHLMTPVQFLTRPLRWLRLMSDKRLQVTGAPNFAYELCIKNIADEKLAGIDLSALRIAFNGAEPIRAQTLRRFAEKFAPCGLDPAALMTCYGLAESTLIVTGRVPALDGVRRFDAAGFDAGRARPARDGIELIASGKAETDGSVRIVDPETCAACPSGTIGEIWIKGPSVALGYWRQPALNEQVFRARIAGENDADYLRTGDLGFVDDGALFISGRLKDLIIHNGRNIHPQDVERVVEECHELLSAGGVVVTGMTQQDEERIAVIAELHRRHAHAFEDVVRAIRLAVAGQVQIPVAAVSLVAPGALLRTTSGKLRRRATGEARARGDLAELSAWMP